MNASMTARLEEVARALIRTYRERRREGSPRSNGCMEPSPTPGRLCVRGGPRPRRGRGRACAVRDRVDGAHRRPHLVGQRARLRDAAVARPGGRRRADREHPRASRTTASGRSAATPAAPSSRARRPRRSASPKLDATVATSIHYVGDGVPGGYNQLTNYKEVVVTVTRNSDARVLSTRDDVHRAADARAVRRHQPGRARRHRHRHRRQHAGRRRADRARHRSERASQPTRPTRTAASSSRA